MNIIHLSYLCNDSRVKGLTITSTSPFILITTVVLVPVSFLNDNNSSRVPVNNEKVVLRII